MLRLISLLVMLLAVPTASLGQQSLAGTYRLVSHALDVDGVVMENMGKAPRGHLVFTQTRVVVFYTAQTRKPGISKAEKAALYDTQTGWSARYRTEGGKLIMSMDASSFETWTGKDQVRSYQLSGNRLTLTSDRQQFPRDPSKTVVVRQVWEKVE